MFRGKSRQACCRYLELVLLGAHGLAVAIDLCAEIKVNKLADERLWQQLQAALVPCKDQHRAVTTPPA